MRTRAAVAVVASMLALLTSTQPSALQVSRRPVVGVLSPGEARTALAAPKLPRPVRNLLKPRSVQPPAVDAPDAALPSFGGVTVLESTGSSAVRVALRRPTIINFNTFSTWGSIKTTGSFAGFLLRSDDPSHIGVGFMRINQPVACETKDVDPATGNCRPSEGFFYTHTPVLSYDGALPLQAGEYLLHMWTDAEQSLRLVFRLSGLEGRETITPAASSPASLQQAVAHSDGELRRYRSPGRLDGTLGQPGLLLGGAWVQRSGGDWTPEDPAGPVTNLTLGRDNDACWNPTRDAPAAGCERRSDIDPEASPAGDWSLGWNFSGFGPAGTPVAAMAMWLPAPAV